MSTELENHAKVPTAIIYISPNLETDDIKTFISRVFIEYDKTTAKIIVHNLYQHPLILAGDLNINFAEENSQSLIQCSIVVFYCTYICLKRLI